VYSLFANPLAERFLAALAARLGGDVELVVYGVATDYCVKAAALGLAERGYRTTLLTDAIAGITEEGTQAALAAMTAKGVRLATSAEVIAEDASQVTGQAKRDYPRPSLAADMVVVAPVEEIGCFSKPGRDPRGWVVSVAHLARVPAERMSEAKPADDAAATAWLDLTITPSGWELSHEGARVEDLAFDHRDVLTAAVARLRAAK